MREPIEQALDAVEWFDMDEPDQLHPGDLYATHEGVLQMPGAPPLKVYQLNDGSRVFDADCIAAWLGGSFPSASVETTP